MKQRSTKGLMNYSFLRLHQSLRQQIELSPALFPYNSFTPPPGNDKVILKPLKAALHSTIQVKYYNQN